MPEINLKTAALDERFTQLIQRFGEMTHVERAVAMSMVRGMQASADDETSEKTIRFIAAIGSFGFELFAAAGEQILNLKPAEPAPETPTA